MTRCFIPIIERCGFQPFDSPLVVPQTPYFRYLWAPCWGVTRRYPNQYAILDSFGTPCFLRADLRTSFLTYIMRTANTRVRRYEFGNVMRMNRECNKCGVQAFASIDTIWQQKWACLRGLRRRPSQCELSVMYSWEAVMVSLQLLKPLAVMIHHPLLLHVNHVGVRA